MPLDKIAEKPRFAPSVKKETHEEMGKKVVIYYTHQCPFTAKYVPLLENVAKKRGVEFKKVCLSTCEQAQSASSPFTSFSLFCSGEFITQEIQSEKKFEKLLDEKSCF